MRSSNWEVRHCVQAFSNPNPSTSPKSRHVWLTMEAVYIAAAANTAEGIVQLLSVFPKEAATTELKDKATAVQMTFGLLAKFSHNILKESDAILELVDVGAQLKAVDQFLRSAQTLIAVRESDLFEGTTMLPLKKLTTIANSLAELNRRCCISLDARASASNGAAKEDLSSRADSERHLISRGAFGATYRTSNDSDGSTRAAKRLNLAMLRSIGIAVKALTHECKVLEGLAHTHIARYFAPVLSPSSELFTVMMEYIEGSTLVDKVTCNPSPTLGELIDWTTQLSSALQYLHDKGLQHRDLKPENVKVTANGQVKIVDLRLACIAGTNGKLLAGGLTVYSSYEKLVDLPYDGRDDMWALGCILLELLTRARYSMLLSLRDTYTLSVCYAYSVLYHVPCDRLYENGGGAICHPELPSVVTRRSALLRAAAIASPRLGGEILPCLLQPLQEHRYTAEALLDELEALNDPVAMPTAYDEEDVNDSVWPQPPLSQQASASAATSPSAATPRNNANPPQPPHHPLNDTVASPAAPTTHTVTPPPTAPASETADETDSPAAGAMGLRVLIAQIRDGSRAEQEDAARELGRLCDAQGTTVRLAAARAIPSLVQLLSGGTVSGQMAAAGVLRSLAMEGENEKPIVDAGAIPCISAILKAGDQQLKLEILRLVRNLAFNAEYASAMVTVGVVACLERLIRTHTAVGALWCIGSHVPSALSVCNNSETVAYLLTQLSSHVSYEQDTAIGLLSLLPGSLVDAAAVQQAGGRKPLDRLLKLPVGDMVPHARSKLQLLKVRLDAVK
jgi:serine/threonine protein kinase